jgi:hypothetical protein
VLLNHILKNAFEICLICENQFCTLNASGKPKNRDTDLNEAANAASYGSLVFLKAVWVPILASKVLHRF